jgi:hypothetical protein
VSVDVQQAQFEYLKQPAGARADDDYVSFYGHFQAAW